MFEGARGRKWEKAVLITLAFCLNFAVIAHESTDTPNRNTVPVLPTSVEISGAFNTPSDTPWALSAGSESFSRLFQAPESESWDFRTCSSLSVTARREKGVLDVLRLHWFVHTRSGWYTTQSPVVVPSGVSMIVTFAFENSLIIPTGHQRPWDSLAAAEVVGIDLRAECTFSSTSASGVDDVINVFLSNAVLNKRENAVAGKAAIITNLTLEPAPQEVAAKSLLRFRIEPPITDPYAPSGEGDVRIRIGDKQSLAFLNQDYNLQSEGEFTRETPAGLPYWQAWLPGLPSATDEVEIVSGSRHWRVPFKSIQTQPAKPAAKRRAPRWEMPLTTAATAVPDDGFIHAWAWSKTGTWIPASSSPNQLTRRNSGEGAVGEAGTGDGDGKVWRPVPFWNQSWGSFGGGFRPDSELARDMDIILAESVANGQARPMIVLDGDMFGHKGVLKWEDHPLRGRLSGPGAIFRSPEGIDFCKRTVRYCEARWGVHKAVSAFWLTADLNVPGISDFYKELGITLQDWTRGRTADVIAWNKCALAPAVVNQLASFESGMDYPLNHWGIDMSTGREYGRVFTGEGSAGRGCYEVRAANSKVTTLALLDRYSLPAVEWNKPAPDNLNSADALFFDVWIPPDAPPDLRVGVHVRDKDFLWFDALLPGMAEPGDWVTYSLDLTGKNADGLKARGHEKSWNDYSRQRITEFGLYVYSTHVNWVPPGRNSGPQALTARFDNIRAVQFPIKPMPAITKLARINVNTDTGLSTAYNGGVQELHPGDLWQCHFTVNKSFANPFDAREADPAALITLPSGKVVRVPAFFDQVCKRRETAPGGDEEVMPVGSEFFTVRYRAAENGPHRVTLELRENGVYNIEKRWQPDDRFSPEGRAQRAVALYWGGVSIQYPNTFVNGRRVVEKVSYVPGNVTAVLDLGAPFSVSPSPSGTFHGFLRASADTQHFEYEDGTFFYPIGPCLRSPSDSRIPYPDPKWNPTEIDRIGRRGTYQYDEYFEAFQKAGINWARVWMCSWSGSLEWRRDWPGYQGCGRYNLLNAWRIDHVLEEAERHGITINLCLTNHGQYSLAIDREWSNNPYNAMLGGPLVNGCEFFTRADAKIAHRNKLRYVVARYSHSPAILAWALFSELEFTEEYYPSYDQEDIHPSINIDEWHSEMAPYLKSIDPSHHLVATHYSHPMHGVSTLKLPEIDVATSNAYSAFAELAENPTHEYDTKRCDAAAALATYWSGNEIIPIAGFKSYHKPGMVEEQGRHWIGVDRRRINNTKVTLDADLHAGLWGSMVQPLAGATGYWWWLHLHFDNRYADYAAFARFMKGEDMRAKNGEMILEPIYRHIGSVLRGRALKSDRREYIWIYHENTPLGIESDPVEGAVLKIGGLLAGQYVVEFWNTYSGEISEKREIKVELVNGLPGSLSLPLPSVNRDLAVKIKPKQ